MATYKLYPVEGIPAFTGGAVGYISYDCVRHFEPKVLTVAPLTLSTSLTRITPNND